tara:strand:- start:200 stop:562 length:363 start_codon:yes stop_codon:yes gene_type:complete
MITDSARNTLATTIKTTYNKIDIGESGSNTDTTATTLQSSILSIYHGNDTSKLTSINSLSQDNVIQFKTSVSGDTYAGFTIREVGVFDGANNMLMRTKIDPIGPLQTGKNYEIKVLMEVE